jgi:hypothetical protein
LNIFGRKKKGQVQCEVFHLFFFSWMIRVFARIAMVFAAEIIFGEGKVCHMKRD